MNTSPIKILLCTCGTNACYHLARILKTNYGDSFYIIGADIHKSWLIPTAGFLDKFYQCPLSSSEGYYDFIVGLCRKHKPDYLIPSFDADQKLFYPENKDLISIGVHSLGTPEETIENFYKDKVTAARFLKTHGLPVPNHYDFAELDDEKAYCIKPINGEGSVGVRLLSGNEIKALGMENIARYIIQEVCSEPEITLECFYDRESGYFSSISRNRIANKAGVCTKTMIFNSPELEEFAKALIKVVRLPLYFNLQFMKNNEGQSVITDVNLRMAGGMSMGFAGGWNAAGALAELLFHTAAQSRSQLKRMIPQKIVPQYIVRAYTDMVTKKIDKVIAFDFDGTLLDSRVRHAVVMADVLRENGLDIDASDLVSFKNNGENNIAWLKTCGINENTAQIIQKRWIELIENARYLAFDKLYDGVSELLEALSRKNSLYLITARGNKTTAGEQIKSLGIEQYFDGAYIVKDGDSKAAALRNCHADIMVGDTELDQKAAKAGNSEFIAVSYGFRSQEFWEEKNLLPSKDIKELNQVLMIKTNKDTIRGGVQI